MDTLIGGAGADTIGVDVSAGDSVDAGAASEAISSFSRCRCSDRGPDLVDQLSIAGTQSGFQHPWTASG